MKLSYLLVLIMFSACSDASQQAGSGMQTDYCEINFTSDRACVYKGVSARIIMSSLAEDEKLLSSIEIIYKNNKQTLTLSPDISLIEGDKGYIYFKDINFDGVPDVAVTTSFGVANLYLDYWVFNKAKKKYVFLGNYAELKVNEKDKILANTVKLNAAQYQDNRYKWNEYKLVKVK